MADPAAQCVYVVTGANRGIGLEIVRRLREATSSGDKIVLAVRDVSRGEEAVRELLSAGGSAGGDVFSVLQLDVTDAASLATFSAKLTELVDSVAISGKDQGLSLRLIHNAGFAFSMTATEPFGEQAEITCGINYFGSVNLVRALVPLFEKLQHRDRQSNPQASASSRIVYVSSTSGESAYASLSAEKRARLDSIVASGTQADLDAYVGAFVEAAKQGSHKEGGWPGSAYGMSKCALTAHARILGRQIAAAGTSGSGIVASATSCCPGLCRTGMTLKNPWSPTSWVFFFATWIVGQSAHAGADTPVWLARDADPAAVNGNFVRKRVVMS